MDVQPFLISSSLLAVLAQRLVRRLCTSCRTPYIPSEEDLRSIDLEPGDFGPPTPLVPDQKPPASLPATEPEEEPTLVRDNLLLGQEDKSGKNGKQPRPVFYRAVGCQACTDTGYTGRIGIYELLVVDEPIRRLIMQNANSSEITRVASQRGMVTLRADGARHVLGGRTSLEEILAATQAGEME